MPSFLAPGSVGSSVAVARVVELTSFQTTQTFKAYESSLSRFPLLPSFSPFSSTSTSSMPGANASTTNMGVAGVESWVARKRGVDVSRRLCRAETAGGRCHNSSCKSVHLASFAPAGEFSVAGTHLHPLIPSPAWLLPSAPADEDLAEFALVAASSFNTPTITSTPTVS
jgi:hypothetical protein